MRKFLALSIVLILLLPLFLLSQDLAVNGQNDNNPTVELGQSVWNHAQLRALLIPPDNASWWNPSYLNDTLRAIGEWNDALSYFAANYSAYSYLSSVNIQGSVSDQMLPNFDINVNWTENAAGNNAYDIGLTTTHSDNRHIKTLVTITLGTRTIEGNTFGDTDAQNIALHELGHTLGLGHSNYTGDVMYPVYNILSPQSLVSTLDGYGISALFAWLQNPSQIYPVDAWLTQNTVMLPSSISFQYLPVQSQNNPPNTPTNNLVVQAFIYLLQLLVVYPIITILVIVAIIFFIAIAIVVRSRR